LQQGEGINNSEELFCAWFARTGYVKSIVMNQIKYFVFLFVLTFAGLFFLPRTTAAPVIFTIDNSQSGVGVSGLIDSAAMTQQPSGSTLILPTSYSGSIKADLSGSTIQFTGGSAINAQNNGNWEPDANSRPNTAPANYGVEASALNFPHGFITVYGALRSISLEVASAALPISGGSFNGTNLVFSFASTDAVLDYYSSSFSGALALNGYATNTVAAGATLSTNGSVITLTIPINTTFVYNLFSTGDTHLQLMGQLVATSSTALAGPIIQSLSVTNQSVVIAAENATLESELLVSTNLTSWSQASATTTTNDVGWIIFTTALNGPRAFFRVQQ
jgi:hypothetical protein